jgi:hypothetical protein
MSDGVIIRADNMDAILLKSFLYVIIVSYSSIAGDNNSLSGHGIGEFRSIKN